VNESRPQEVEQMNFFALKICFITLILCLFKVSKATESVDISRDFKILLTYFSEAFLKGATFDGKRLEGDNQTSVARYLIEAIGNLAVGHSNLPELDELMTFKEQLAAGIPLAEAMISSQSQITLKADALNIQTQFIDSLKEKGGVILPITWKGHALSLIVRKGNKEDTFDFAIVNTGQGLQFHYHSADPNGVYPTLSQIWMEFLGVKGEELFSNDAWFFQGLIALQKDFLQNKLGVVQTGELDCTCAFPCNSHKYTKSNAPLKEHCINRVPLANQFYRFNEYSCGYNCRCHFLVYTSSSYLRH
jgi:hypothetical protein